MIAFECCNFIICIKCESKWEKRRKTWSMHFNDRQYKNM